MRRTSLLLAVAVSTICILAGFLLFIISPPNDFPTGEILSIAEGLPLRDIGARLENFRAVRAGSAFVLFVSLIGQDESVKAGQYLFDEPYNLITLARKMIAGDFNVPYERIVIPEGTDNAGIAEILARDLPGFDKADFLLEAEKLEGRLFPDTYFFYPMTDTGDILTAFLNNFQTRVTEALADRIKASPRSLDDILIMASIIEREVARPEDRMLVSGVLWNRIKLGLPLQVDAPFMRILGKSTYELTTEDLQFDSPYNSYKYAGLPPGPIGNPGLIAILAALEPPQTEFLYFVSDKDGNTYYAKTLKEHNANVAKHF